MWLKLWLVASSSSSRLDYCNSLFADMLALNFDKLQRVQNTLVRVVLRRGKCDHIISSSLGEFHCLPVRQRVHFKSRLPRAMIRENIMPSTYTCVMFCVTMRHLVVCVRPLKICYTSRPKTVIISRAFRHVAANSWNSFV